MRFGVILAIASLLAARTVAAHEDPPGCFEPPSPVFVGGVFRADGTTPVAGSVSECESIFFQVRLQKRIPDDDGICAFSGGTFTLTTPDGIVHTISLDVPCIGGTSGEGCDPTVDFIESALIPYTVRPEDVSGGQLQIITTYQGGIAHDSDANTAGVGATVPKSLGVAFCLNDNDNCTTDGCDPTQPGVTACSHVPIVCNDDNGCTADACNPASGQCVFTPNVVCNDDDACTQDACNPATGACEFIPSVVCNDDDACTQDACDPATGQCQFIDTVTPTCDDGDVCSIDACDPTTGLCTHAPAAAGIVCRPAVGACDVAETCTGSSPACPADAFRPASTTCRTAVGACDVAETCTGSSAACPADALRPSTFECRAATGACDVAETCSGSGTTCPADGVAPSGQVCRPAVSACDQAETCDGALKTCPADATSCSPACDGKPDGAECDDGDTCTGADRCAEGVCQNGVECRGIGIPVLPPNASAPKLPVDVELQDTGGVAKTGLVVAFGVLASSRASASVAAASTGETRVTATVKRKLTAANGFSAHFTLRLTKKGKKLLRQSPNGLDVDVVVTVTDRNGVSTTRRDRQTWPKAVRR